MVPILTWFFAETGNLLELELIMDTFTALAQLQLSQISNGFYKNLLWHKQICVTTNKLSHLEVEMQLLAIDYAQ